MSQLPVLVAAALMASGVVLILFATSSKKDALRDRVQLLRSRIEPSTGIISKKGAARSITRISVNMPGLSVPLQREIGYWIARLHLPSGHAALLFTALRLACVVAGALAVYAFRGSGTLSLLLAAAMGIIGWLALPFVLRTTAKRRAKAIATGLPDALELLVVCVEAGLALQDSIDRIIGELEISQPLLAAELALTSADLKILPSRDQALANLAERVDIPSVHSVVATLTQTMRYGTPLAQAMRTVAAQMRTESLIDLQERANRLPALMTVPMMLFIMPAIFLIVGGPAILRLMDSLAR